eukprot:SAG11_NODE_76_length_18005_cov_6.523958_4_plen_128_part_00
MLRRWLPSHSERRELDAALARTVANSERRLFVSSCWGPFNDFLRANRATGVPPPLHLLLRLLPPCHWQSCSACPLVHVTLQSHWAVWRVPAMVTNALQMVWSQVCLWSLHHRGLTVVNCTELMGWEQ